MSAFLVARHRAAHQVVELDHEDYPPRLEAVIDGMICEFRLYPDALPANVAVYVPTDLPPEIADEWVREYLDDAD